MVRQAFPAPSGWGQQWYQGLAQSVPLAWAAHRIAMADAD